jgi:hypothetical protein
MKTAEHSPLLSDPPQGRHLAQFHRTSDTLVDSVAHYLAEGLRRGEPVIALLEEKHIRPMIEALNRENVDTASAIIRDAGECLERFMIGDYPDPQRFRGMIEELFAAAQRHSTKPVRLYGEMVSSLWREGRTQAAIRVEELWNEAIKEHPIRLLCCYLMDSHDPASYRDPVHQIGHAHTDVLPTNEDDRLLSALDAACKETFGFPLDRMMEREQGEGGEGESKLAGGQRAMMWIIRHVPGSVAKLLQRTREILERPPKRK